MEVVVSRMKAIRNHQTKKSADGGLRFVALSATVPNIEDIATGLGTDTTPAQHFAFGEEYVLARLHAAPAVTEGATPDAGAVSGFE